MSVVDRRPMARRQTGACGSEYDQKRAPSTYWHHRGAKVCCTSWLTTITSTITLVFLAVIISEDTINTSLQHLPGCLGYSDWFGTG